MSQIFLKDYAQNETEISESSDIKNLRQIANTELKKLLQERQSNLIVFPPQIGFHYDGIEDRCIIKLRESNDKAYIKAEDLLGYVGISDTFLNIGTRFTDETKEDFLLHYMLQKVLKINIFKF